MTRRRAFLERCGALATLFAAGCVGAPGSVGPTETEAGVGLAGTTTPTAAPTATPASTATGTATGSPATAGTTTAGGQVVDVAAGPEGRLRFDPETVEIAVGDTVRWTFESAGHNVTTKPGASEKVRLPAGAEPFASYEGDQHFAINEVGTTYEHAFAVPGEYVYVCAPHADQGMVGTVVVSG